MPLAIAIVIIQQVTFLSYLVESGFFTTVATDETHALMVGVALFSAMLSIPSFIWNYIMAKEENKKRDIVGIIMSIATFAFGVWFVVFDYIYQLHAIGLHLF